MSEQERPSRAPGVELTAEIMAWHGMARYADPDVLEPYVRPVRRQEVDSADSGGAAERE